METKLRARVVGQEIAISAISHALRRAQTGIGDHTRPIGSFLLAGPTGNEPLKILCPCSSSMGTFNPAIRSKSMRQTPEFRLANSAVNV